ncbi:DNA-binding response regulator [Rhodohalobacter barkolensis]|uniref:DNA-binding response regulator n=2 Tax=Rhodohalobacter barkolensis TaxID=2053187 RepID=A0A2N0VMI8_9BACT|nr:DNA-binding response regulator [Rhodohalobacter barkolensis]
MKILVVEDDPTVRTLVKAVLEHRGNDVAVAETAGDGEDKALNNKFDMIILDLRLPDGNGYDVCAKIREEGVTTPVLVLSAEHETDVKVKVLNVGADDYLTKPFNSDELMARLDAIARRSTSKDSEKELTCGSLKVDLITRKMIINEEEIDLTNNEFNLLVYFVRNKGRIISQEELASNVWDIHFDTQTNYINVYISYLRKKMREHSEFDFIETIRKKGFMFQCDED